MQVIPSGYFFPFCIAVAIDHTRFRFFIAKTEKARIRRNGEPSLWGRAALASHFHGVIMGTKLHWEVARGVSIYACGVVMGYRFSRHDNV